MKRTIAALPNTSHEEKILRKALRTGGFVFPETVDEVNEFERIYGATDVILPAELESANFLISQSPKIRKGHVVKLHVENLAMAAREGSTSLPDEIKKMMAEDRKKADAKRKRRK